MKKFLTLMLVLLLPASAAAQIYPKPDEVCDYIRLVNPGDALPAINGVDNINIGTLGYKTLIPLRLTRVGGQVNTTGGGATKVTLRMKVGSITAQSTDTTIDAGQTDSLASTVQPKLSIINVAAGSTITWDLIHGDTNGSARGLIGVMCHSR